MSQIEATARRPGVIEMGSAYRAYVLFILVVVYTFNFIDRVIVGILAEPIKADLQLTDTQLGWMGGPAFAIFYTLLGIPIARLADRTSRTWVMTGALALWSGFTALCGQAQSFWHLLVARAGVGVGEAGGVAPAYSLVSDYFPPQQRARALAVFSFGIPIGSGLGFLFGGLIASTLSWRSAFIMVGLAGIALAPLFRLTVKEPVRGGLDARAAYARSSTFRDTLRVIAGKRGFWGLSFGAACASIVGYGLLFWLPSFFIRVHHLSLADASLYLGIGIIVFQTAGIWLGGWAGDRFGARSKAAYALVPAVLLTMLVPFMIGGALAPSLGVALLLFIGPVMLNAAWIGPVLSALQHLVAPDQRATASAIFLFINNLIGIGGGSLFLGAMSDLFMPRYGSESLRYAMIAASGFYVLSISLLYFASRHLARDWEHA
jgi:predicted MFS family arabinose efflux permease